MATILEALQAAVAHHQAGRLPQAESVYRQVLRANARQPHAWHLLGVIAHQQGQHATAIQYIRHAIELEASQPAFFNNLGAAYRALGQPGEAQICCEQALRLNPSDAAAHNNLGLVLQDQRRHAEAASAYRQALELQPSHAEVHCNLGVALNDCGQIDEAISAFEQAVELRPNFVDAHVHLGLRYADQGRAVDALQCYERALQLQPDHAEAHAARALVWLQAEQFTQGWPEYEWRFQTHKATPRVLSQPRWDGTPLAGRTLLIYADQGLGDVIQFIRYAEQIHLGGGTVLVECPAGLATLLADVPGIDRLIPKGDPLPEFDVQISLLSVPGVLHTTLQNIPNKTPYLRAQPERVERWSSELAGLRGLKVGIAWQGSATYIGDRWRSIRLAEFAPLAAVRDVQLVSLQQGHGTEQLAEWAEPLSIYIPPGEVDPPHEAFVDTAAILTQLDLVVTSDSAVAHLAGALGVPIWVALSTSSEWRWGLEREQTPWYPTMRLFRQRRLGDWSEVFQRIASELTQLPRGRE